AIGRQVGAGVLGLVLLALLMLLDWYVWALVTYLIGTRWLPGAKTQADVGQLLRTLGFASAPGIVGVLGAIPGLGAVINPLVWLWMVAAMVVAVRQALDYDTTGRAIAVVVIGFLVYVVIGALAGTLAGLLGGAPVAPVPPAGP